MSVNSQEIGTTGVQIPAICFGTSALGNMPDTYSYEVSEVRAIETLEAILSSPIPFLDTSRVYGMGRSEERIGKVISKMGGLPQGAIISTKLDRDLGSNQLDAEQARRSLEESLEALGLDHVDILHLHDPEHVDSLHSITRPGGAIDELFKMREEGLCKVVGLAAGNVDVMMPILRERDFDVLLTHNRHTLVCNNAEPMITYANENNIAVMNASPYCGGVLARGTAHYKRYVYQEATGEMLAPIQAIEKICQQYDVPPGAVALQFSLNDPRIHSTVCGVDKPEFVEQTLAWASVEIPEQVRKELSVLPRSDADPEATREYKPE